MMNEKIGRKNEYFRYYLAAGLLGAGLFAFFFATARLGVPTVDEADYCNLRFLQGDIPFVEWWDPAQLFWLTLTPVVGLYRRIVGSTEGILLFMRYVFLVADLFFYVFMVRILRRYRAAGLLGAGLFCAVAPQTLFAVSYFTESAFLVYGVALLLLFGEKRRSAALLVFLGALLAVGIMTEPFLIFIYIIYMGAVCAREFLKSKKYHLEAYAFLLNARTCLFLTLGAFAVFMALVCFLAIRGSLARLAEMLPFIFGGVKYTGASVFGDSKFRLAISFFGVVPSVCFLLMPLGAAVLYMIRRPCRGARLILFALSCVFGAFLWGRLFFGVFVTGNTDLVNAINYHGVLLQPFALSWYFLARKKDPRVFACLMTALLFGAAVDLGSSSVLGVGGTAAAFPGFYSFFLLAREASEALKQACAEEHPVIPAFGKGGAAAALLTACVCMLSFFAWNAAFTGLETVNSPIEHYISPTFTGDHVPYAVKLEKGPFAGIVTSAKIASIYNDALSDLDRVRDLADGGPVMNYGFIPFAYLYLDLPYGSHGAWYDGDLDRTLAYWALFPERKPACVYIPLFDNLYWATPQDLGFGAAGGKHVRDAEAALSVLGPFETVEGKAGVILRPAGE